MPRLSFIILKSLVAILSVCWYLSDHVFAREPNLREFSETYQSALFAIHSDKDALNFYKKYWQRFSNLPPRHHQSSHSSSGQDTSHHTSLIANLLASRLAVIMQSAIQQQNLKAIQPFSDQQQQAREWAMSKSVPHSISHMLDFHTHLRTFIPKKSLHLTGTSQFEKFAAYLDQQYPVLTGSEDSWVALLERGQLSNLDQRLSEYWRHASAKDSSLHGKSSPSPSNIDQYAQHYARTRLWPVYKSHLIALTIRAEMEAIQFATHAMEQHTNSHTANLARLCGTWHWMVHNHQNHGDHKMTLFLGDPSKSPTAQPQPTEIHIHGDTVYLLWRFPKGFQEDSLLLSQEDKRLEGTFHNTLGPHGSITGKRLSFCTPHEAPPLTHK